MDETTRNTLRWIITECRRILEASISEIFEGKYGIDSYGNIDPLDRLTHLTEEEKKTRELLIANYNHLISSEISKPDSVSQLAREIAFTHLNRLCAYKMLERRGLITESVTRGTSSNGFLTYVSEHEIEHQLWLQGDVESAYRRFLLSLGSELSNEIGVLFSPEDLACGIFPPLRVLNEVLEKINQEDLSSIWENDETIGWIYQYFTPKELRETARKESQTPRNSYEMAFRNQFFTPRYVVKFLADNTLGRVWYEMRQGKTNLQEMCEYFVRYNDEVFLSDISNQSSISMFLNGGSEELPNQNDFVNAVSNFDWLNDPRWDQWNKWLYTDALPSEEYSKVRTQDLWDFCYALFKKKEGNLDIASKLVFDFVEQMVLERIDRSTLKMKENGKREPSPYLVTFRNKKDPRDMRIIDPACGSGHFLIYCFDLLELIYNEAWDDSDGPPMNGGRILREEYPDFSEFKKAIPGLILKYNLHGIDIDLRAAQIASLALWLRAQRSYQSMGLDRAHRPRILKINIACAESMPGEEEFLNEFSSKINPPVLGNLIRAIFGKMQLASEIGSLLKIEEEIKESINDAKQQWLLRPKSVQTSLCSNQTINNKPELSYNFSGISDETSWTLIENQLIDELRSYAGSIANSNPVGRRLFSEDTERGFSFIELSQKSYDVVLMNPPFGAACISSKKYLDDRYPLSKADLHTAFIDRFIGKLEKGGMLGALTSRTSFFLTSFERYRDELILDNAPPSLVADLGMNVLDTALVETSAYCLKKEKNQHNALFIQLLSNDRKDELLLKQIRSINAEIIEKDVFSIDLRLLRQIPGSPLAYWLSPSLTRCYSDHPKVGDHSPPKQGLATADDFRFLRTWWEVPTDTILDGTEKTDWESKKDEFSDWCMLQTTGRIRWVNFAKGGEYSPYFSDTRLVVDWKDDGSEIKGIKDDKGRTISRPQNTQYYYLEGLTWPRRTTSIISFRPLNAASIFSDKSPTIFGANLLSRLAILQSQPFRALMSPHIAAADTAARSYEVGVINKTPIPVIPEDVKKQIEDKVKRMMDLKWELSMWDETSHYFTFPFPLYAHLSGCKTIEAISDKWSAEVKLSEEEIERMQNEIDAVSCDLYHVSYDECNEINQRMEAKSQQQYLLKTRDFAVQLISYAIGAGFGRWDINRIYSTINRDRKKGDYFAPLPPRSPGMFTKHEQNLLELSSTTEKYPAEIKADGILTDDENHPDDIVAKTLKILGLTMREDYPETQIVKALEVKTIRDYIRRPGKGGFWDDHVKQYTESHRYSPIYWLLQSSRKNYSIWIYYHKYGSDTLFRALELYIKPKIQKEKKRLEDLLQQNEESRAVGKTSKKLESSIQKQEELIIELGDFQEKVLKVANLNIVPDLNDGVILNIAPLHEIVPFKPAKQYWHELLEGKYEWSSIARQLRDRKLVRD